MKSITSWISLIQFVLIFAVPLYILPQLTAMTHYNKNDKISPLFRIAVVENRPQGIVYETIEWKTYRDSHEKFKTKISFDEHKIKELTNGLISKVSNNRYKINHETRAGKLLYSISEYAIEDDGTVIPKSFYYFDAIRGIPLIPLFFILTLLINWLVKKYIIKPSGKKGG